jgi:hypothetical protein
MKRARKEAFEWLLKQPMWVALATLWFIAAEFLVLTLYVELLILRLLGQRI